MGKLGIIEDEATPLVINEDDLEATPKWLIVGKIIFHNLFYIQTISSALRRA